MKFSIIGTAYLVHLATINVVSGVSDDSSAFGTGVGSLESRQIWWDLLDKEDKVALTSLFEQSWFENEIDQDTRIAYAYTAQQVYDFLESGADSDETDHYIGFAPLLLRASFHGSGTYTHASGTGGSNGGTIFNHAELEDGGNGCIATASNELFSIFHGSSLVPLADTMVIAGVVALDFMNFPRMDLVAMTGGRDTVKHIAHRDRLPSADDDPMTRFVGQYDLTLSQTVALIGGAHNFGAAHGKCSGYRGQWTPTPLDWFGPDSSEPTFFSDLLLEDWRWYEVCTYQNNTVSYARVNDPFHGTSAVVEEEETGVAAENICAIRQSREPMKCEKQAMRGCWFPDGSYPLDESPCDIDKLQFRLRSDFSLKANPKLFPYAKAFAADADLLAEEFGQAYHKITHNGLNRCGLSGHGCAQGHICKSVVEGDPMTAMCVFNGTAAEASRASSMAEEYEAVDHDLEQPALIPLVSLTLGLVAITMVLGILTLIRVNKLIEGDDVPPPPPIEFRKVDARSRGSDEETQHS